MGLATKLERLGDRAKRLVAGSSLGGKNHYCPMCDKHSARFLDFGVPPRSEVMCPHCSSLERHRLLWLFLKERTDIFTRTGGKMLHVAPEECLRDHFAKQFAGDYLTADFLVSNVDVKMDIQDIQFPDETFDVIYCSHVLEHVDDDRKAMREFRRVLKKDGWAILLVPISAEKTYEDPSITDPEERLKHFGQSDHVRRYGPDYVDRLRVADFVVTETRPSDLTDVAFAEKARLSEGNTIYFCTRGD
ncbi:class I SAM-dependent methyltransferase [Altererythrobacter sp. ZODW24]|uniref:class I SAM-dependent methyltransferase n=1 Tax=Altererythrobacter sp. ZODW24 TaxID=2185142 RepID=UPI0019655CDA|nr:class I SAM-dependent methyltransferase [Altererythrobacter sp. ZODW24]